MPHGIAPTNQDSTSAARRIHDYVLSGFIDRADTGATQFVETRTLSASPLVSAYLALSRICSILVLPSASPIVVAAFAVSRSRRRQRALRRKDALVGR